MLAGSPSCGSASGSSLLRAIWLGGSPSGGSALGGTCLGGSPSGCSALGSSWLGGCWSGGSPSVGGESKGRLPGAGEPRDGETVDGVSGGGACGCRRGGAPESGLASGAEAPVSCGVGDKRAEGGRVWTPIVLGISGDDVETTGGGLRNEIAVVADAPAVDALDCAFLPPIDVEDGSLLASATDVTARADGGRSACSHGNLAVSIYFAVGDSCAHV